MHAWNKNSKHGCALKVNDPVVEGAVDPHPDAVGGQDVLLGEVQGGRPVGDVIGVCGAVVYYTMLLCAILCSAPVHSIIMQ
jgi:hypothetical protein